MLDTKTSPPVHFLEEPEPDYIGVPEDKLPY